MFSWIPCAQFFRGVLVGLAFATLVSGAGLALAMLAVPSPAAGITVPFLSP
jgi:hypothetical protein